MVQIGTLDRRILIERPVTTRNAHNEPVATWVPLATVWAAKRDLNGSERFGGDQIVADVTTEFKIRWRGDVTPKHRILYGGLVYDIKGTKELGRREALIIFTAARTDESIV